jgi:hypothetical protein
MAQLPEDDNLEAKLAQYRKDYIKRVEYVKHIITEYKALQTSTISDEILDKISTTSKQIFHLRYEKDIPKHQLLKGPFTPTSFLVGAYSYYIGRQAAPFSGGWSKPDINKSPYIYDGDKLVRISFDESYVDANFDVWVYYNGGCSPAKKVCNLLTDGPEKWTKCKY